MQKHIVLFSSAIAAIILAAMLEFTNPTDIGALGVFIFLIVFYVLVYGVSTLLVRFFTKLSRKKPSRRTNFYAAIVAFGPLMILLMNSLGSLSLVSFCLVIVLVFLGCFWVSKRM